MYRWVPNFNLLQRYIFQHRTLLLLIESENGLIASVMFTYML